MDWLKKADNFGICLKDKERKGCGQGEKETAGMAMRVRSVATTIAKNGIFLFKLYPWEWMVQEEFGEKLLLAYFISAIILLVIYSKIYEKVTPYREFDLIREGNTAVKTQAAPSPGISSSDWVMNTIVLELAA